MNEQGNGNRQTERPHKLRRNVRVNMRFPVRIEVPSGGGRTRVLHAYTVVVSHAGATLDMDETIPLEMGLQVTPPFGGTILAEVNGAWLDRRTGRHRVSIRLIDPTAWTAPERLMVPDACVETVGVQLHPRVWQLLAEYSSFLNETRGGRRTPSEAAERMLEESILADLGFQDWLAAKIMEDLKAWEDVSVVRQ